MIFNRITYYNVEFRVGLLLIKLKIEVWAKTRLLITDSNEIEIELQNGARASI